MIILSLGYRYSVNNLVGLFTTFCFQDALSWGGPLEVELQDAARALRLSQIVQRYHVTGFRLGDAPRATRLLR